MEPHARAVSLHRIPSGPAFKRTKEYHMLPHKPLDLSFRMNRQKQQDVC
jgi:hypothetical protein